MLKEAVIGVVGFEFSMFLIHTLGSFPGAEQYLHGGIGFTPVVCTETVIRDSLHDQKTL